MRGDGVVELGGVVRDDGFRSRGVVGVVERTDVDAGDPRASNALFVYGERTGFVE